MIKKLCCIISIIVLIIIILFSILYFYYDLKVVSIKQLNFNKETNELTIEIIKKDNIFDKNFNCILSTDSNIIKEIGKNNKCTLTFKVGNNYNLILEDKYKKSNNYNILNYIDNILEFEFVHDTIYMSIGEEKQIEYTYISIDGTINEFTTKDDIISINNDKVIAKEKGTATIYNGKNKLNVVVTDLVTEPAIEKKEKVPCNKYNEEEGLLLDKILEYKVKEAGLKTRAGVVAAARFLTLQLPYKIPYFYENGRVNNTGVNFADGEGRYYHKGLYFTESKKKDLIASISGPSTWGCPLYNWEDAPEYGYIWGTKMPNGLDCSGFVSWSLYNGGYDPGDIGAGNSVYKNELTDLGEFKELTNSLINSDIIKAGDLVNYWGHIAMIIGVDDENFYVAESLQDYGGVVVNTYKKTKINQMFQYVVLMDSYYEKDGNYTKYW